MPHFSPFSVDDRLSKIDLVGETLTQNFAKRGLKHNDVYWRNRDFTGAECAVVFDMGSVEKCDDTSWVEAACNRLSSQLVEVDY